MTIIEHPEIVSILILLTLIIGIDLIVEGAHEVYTMVRDRYNPPSYKMVDIVRTPEGCLGLVNGKVQFKSYERRLLRR